MLAVLAIAALTAQLGTPIEITDYPGGSSAMAAGDFDGDGVDDVLLSVKDLERLVLFQGTADGTLRRSRFLGPALATFSGLTVCDLDQDGDGDVVALDEASGRVYVYVNVGGSALAAPSLVADFGAPVGAIDPFDVVCKDMTGDGANDIVVAINDSATNPEIGVWLIESNPGALQPTTTFSVATRLWDEVATAAEPILEDIDGDGDLDLALIRPVTQRVIWARNDGAFPLTSRSALTDVIPGLVSAQIGDVDADGTIDVLATSSDLAAKLQIARGLGGGSFAPSTDFQLSTNAVRRRIRIQLADFDGDGILDILEEFTDGTNLYSVGWFRNFGSGTSLVNRTFLSRASGERLGASIADLDGDGRLDVVSAVGSGASVQVPPVRWHVNSPAPVALSFIETIPVTLRARRTDRLTAADLSGDGLQDVILGSSSTFGSSGQPLLALGQASGSLGRLQPPLFESGAGTLPMIPLDFDGDGDLDLLAANVVDIGTGFDFDIRNAALWMINDGDAGFTAGQDFGAPLSQPIQFTGLLDDDGDAVAEVIELVDDDLRIHARNAQGNFPAGPGLLIGAGSYAFTANVAIGDLDGDGLEDLAYFRRTSLSGPCTLRFLRNAPGTGFAPEVEFPGIVNAGTLQVVDLDQDGDLDLLNVVNGAETRLLRNEGAAASFSQTPLVPTAIGASITYGVVALDGNGDGLLDLVRAGFEVVSAGESIPTISLAAGLGGGSFGGFVDVQTRESGSFAGFYLVDVDGDGDQDLMTGWSDGVQIYYPNELSRWIGVSECGPAVPNITGAPGRIQAVGTDLAADDRLSIQAFSLVPNTLGIFITSQTAQVTQLQNSLGRLCLGGQIGRFTRPGDTISTGPQGFMELGVPLSDLPTAQGPVSAIAGQTWRFQAWTRDLVPVTLVPTSNFTDAVAITLR